MAEKKPYKSYTYSKKQIREMITEKFGEENVTVELDDILALFESKSGGPTGEATTIKDADGNVVAKRCSYFEEFLPIEHFGTVGKDDDGNPKYAYQSKPAQAIVRATKKQVAEMLDKADAVLEETEDIEQWKELKAEAAALEAEKQPLPDDIEIFKA